MELSLGSPVNSTLKFFLNLPAASQQTPSDHTINRAASTFLIHSPHDSYPFFHKGFLHIIKDFFYISLIEKVIRNY